MYNKYQSILFVHFALLNDFSIQKLDRLVQTFTMLICILIQIKNNINFNYIKIKRRIMSLVSKDSEIQENITVLVEDLQNTIHDLKNRIADYGHLYNEARVRNIASDVYNEEMADQIGEKHHSIYHKMKSLHYLLEIINDYEDGNGMYHDHHDMIDQIQQIMLSYAEKENYEAAATIKKWYDRLHAAIYIR